MDIAKPSRVVVINDRSVALGGATSVALLSVNLLLQRGIAVTFLSGDGGVNSELASSGAQVHGMGGSALLEKKSVLKLASGVFNRTARSYLADWISRFDDPNTIYHVHTWNQILSPSIFAALYPVRSRLFITAHDYFLACPNGAYSNFQSSSSCALTPLSGRCIATNCDRRSYSHKVWRVVRQMVQNFNLLFDKSGPRVLIIHSNMRSRLVRGGVPTDAIITLPNPIRPWSKTRIRAENNRVFVFVGRLSHEKGPDLAAQAAREAHVPLLVIGDGVESEALKRIYPEVKFAGRQSKDSIANLVRNARALVMPSRLPEPYGLVACEALWSGLPVIVTDQALLASDIVARGAGVACDLHASSSLSDAMKLLSSNDELTQQMSRNAFGLTKNLGCHIDEWIDLTIEAYRSSLDAAGSFVG